MKLGERESGTERLEEALRAVEMGRSVYNEAGLLHYESYFEERVQMIRRLISQRVSNSETRERS